MQDATNIITITIVFHKKPPSKNQLLRRAGKKHRRAKKVPLVQVCVLWAPPLPGPRHQVTGASSLPHHCPTPTVSATQQSVRRGVHISLMVADSLGLTVRAPSSKPSNVT